VAAVLRSHRGCYARRMPCYDTTTRSVEAGAAACGWPTIHSGSLSATEQQVCIYPDAAGAESPTQKIYGEDQDGVAAGSCAPRQRSLTRLHIVRQASPVE